MVVGDWGSEILVLIDDIVLVEFGEVVGVVLEHDDSLSALTYIL